MMMVSPRRAARFAADRKCRQRVAPWQWPVRRFERRGDFRPPPRRAPLRDERRELFDIPDHVDRKPPHAGTAKGAATRESDRYSAKYWSIVRESGKRRHASSRQCSGLSNDTRAIASAISAESLTRKPVLPCSMVSISAPRAKLTTGVPAASASRATSELVSSTSDGINTQRAMASSSRFAENPTG